MAPGALSGLMRQEEKVSSSKRQGSMLKVRNCRNKTHRTTLQQTAQNIVQQTLQQTVQHTVQHTVWVDATTRKGLLLQLEGLDAQGTQLPQLFCNCCNSHATVASVL